MEPNMKNGKSMNMKDGKPMEGGHYGRLVLMMILSLIAMYLLMYAMIDRLDNFVNNVNQFYMAGLMAAPMLILELVLMRSMYKDKTLNAILIGVGVLALAGFWMLIRQQGAVGDRQFLRSMIPHHAGAILMCEQAKLQNPEVLQLCEGIVSSQQSEIAQMKAILARQK